MNLSSAVSKFDAGIGAATAQDTAPAKGSSGSPTLPCEAQYEVDVITGVSGGSFTTLAHGLYGEKLFADYEQRFLKRNVQGELISRLLNPTYWGALGSPGWGRSELAAQLYDEILFNGATFADLDRGDGPLVLASATDISTGARFVFNQNHFRHSLLGPQCRSVVQHGPRGCPRAARSGRRDLRHRRVVSCAEG
jgi:hypothetical protein